MLTRIVSALAVYVVCFAPAVASQELSRSTYFPSVDKLLAWQVDGQLLGEAPTGQALDRLAALVNDLNTAHDELAQAHHDRMEALFHGWIADGSIAPLNAPLTRLAPDAVGRFIGGVNGETYAIDIPVGVDAQLDALDATLEDLRAQGTRAILNSFGNDASFTTAASKDSEGEGNTVAPSEPNCEFTTRTVITGTIPSCIATWGVSYSMSDGSCDPETGCNGTITASMTDDPTNPCADVGYRTNTDDNILDDDHTMGPGGPFWWPNPFAPNDIQGPVSVAMACGSLMVITFSASDAGPASDFGKIYLQCDSCGY